jgi:hypothetical protein
MNLSTSQMSLVTPHQLVLLEHFAFCEIVGQYRECVLARRSAFVIDINEKKRHGPRYCLYTREESLRSALVGLQRLYGI